jgi:hypothetical protein
MARRWCFVAVAVAIGCGDRTRDAPVAAEQPVPPKKKTQSVLSARLAGTVIDRSTAKPVGDIDVVLHGDEEITARAGADGRFELYVEPGAYHVFVRSDRYLSLAVSDRNRLDNAPRAELAGKLDEALMPVLVADGDIQGLEIGVFPAAKLSGVVYDDHDDRAPGAVVRLRPFDPTTAIVARRASIVRPVGGSDTVVADHVGEFSMAVAPGHYLVEVFHPRLGGLRYGKTVDLGAGANPAVSLELARGCIISGRVVNSDGSPAADGALELSSTGGAQSFGPASRIDNGTFVWTTTSDVDVELRAWPWRSPPTPSKTFACKDGKRYTDVVLRVPDQRPDMSGTIVDAEGEPVPLAYLDVQPLDDVPHGQQERADAGGNWHVYDMPPARYRITATAPGSGVVDTIVVAPRLDLRLVFGGTGRILGTTTELIDGSLEVSFLHCGSADQPLAVAHEPRIVAVRGGRFTIDKAPACALTFSVRWRDRVIQASAVVEPERAAYVDVDVGEPRAKTVTGIVRDVGGDPVSGARVTAVLREREAETARTDANGRFTLHTHSGAQLVAGHGDRTGHADVGRAAVASEQIDVVLDGN